MTPVVKQSDDVAACASRPALRRVDIRVVTLVLAIIALTVALQVAGGSYRTELSGYPDEPAHLITGLMVRDYILSGFKTPPMQFAEDYYLHYPKVAFGIWPPLFHFVEAGWFLIAPPSKTSAFLLQALITALLAASAGLVAARRFGWTIAVAVAACIVALPAVQAFTAMVMADDLMSLLAFWAMLALSAYLERETWRRALLLGLLIGLALMTKSNGAALAPMAPLALLLLRRYRGLLSPRLWVAGALALAIAVPWQLLVIRFWTSTTQPLPYSWAQAMYMFRAHLFMYWNVPGTVIVLLAFAGFVRKVILPWARHELEPFWAAATALVLALFLFGLAPLPPEPRYHVAAFAVIVLFAGGGVHEISRYLPSRFPSALRITATAGVAAALFLATQFRIPQRREYGFTEAARSIVARPEFRDSVMLVSSENGGDGMFIPEIALREARPTHYVLRGTKVLGRSRWNADRYEVVYNTPEAMQQYLESIPVRLLIVDRTPGRSAMEHHRILLQVLQQYKDKWRHIAMYPAAGRNADGGQIEVYEMVNPPPGRARIRVDMQYTLKKTL